MMRRAIIYLFFLLLLLAEQGRPSSAKIKQYRTFNDFIAGESKGVAIGHEGYLTLSPRVDHLFEASFPQIWRLVKIGNTLYAAAGTPAALIRFTADGDTTTLFQSDASAVFALAKDPKNHLWFAPSPGGELYRYDGSTVKKVLELDVTYIWDIMPWQGSLLVATGEPGNIYQVFADGRNKVFYESTETHIRVLALDAGGNVYAGSADNGLVFRFDRQGKPFVVYDSPQTEIFAIIPLADGNVWAAGASEGLQRPSPSSARVSITEMSIEGEGGKEGESDAPARISTPGRISGRANRGAVFMISPRGVARNLWQGVKDRVQSICRFGDQALLVGTGENGKIYEVFRDGRINLKTDLEPSQITFLLPDADGSVYAASSNLGGAYAIRTRPVKRGEFLSSVIDAGMHARWGSLSWKSSGTVQLFVRSGNSEKPDNTWSDWYGPLKEATGSEMDVPVARFLQWRAVLEADGKKSPRLDEVTVGYMQQNVAPVIESITIYKPGVAFPDAVSEGRKNNPAEAHKESSNGRLRSSRSWKRETRQGYQSVGWKASDENGDRLVYDVYYKSVDSPVWRVLVKDYKTTVYSWDSRTLEDGTYLVKIVARDDRSNPPGFALKSEKISRPFVIDNTPPVISPLKLVKRQEKKITFTATDDGSRIRAAYYAVDAGEWVILYPEDGIADSPAERFSIDVSRLEPGEHIISVKVYDQNDNVRYRHLNFRL